MERAADQAAGGTAGTPSRDDALEELRWHWGDAYEIETGNGEWRARRRDGLDGWMTEGSADELHTRIVDDYTTRPVRRSPAKK